MAHKVRGKGTRSAGEELLALHIRAANLPEPAREFHFAKEVRNPRTGRPRMFRFDFAWESLMLAVEVDGGNFLVRRGKDGKPVPVGRHTQAADYEKLNLAALLGWRVLRFTPQMIRNGTALKVLLEVKMR